MHPQLQVVHDESIWRKAHWAMTTFWQVSFDDDGVRHSERMDESDSLT